MANRMRRHYRAAQKRIEQVSPKIKGVFVSKKQKDRLMIMAAVFLTIVFVKGILIGYIIGRKKS